MRIRSARNDDWKECLTLDGSYETSIAWQMEEQRSENEWRVSFREVNLPRTQHIHPHYTPEEQLKAWQRRDGFWVATERAKIRGYSGVVLEPNHRQVRLADLVVAPAERRKGLATQLLYYAVDWCLRQDVDQMILECSLKAEPAIAFAQRNGFSVCGFQDAYWPGQEVGLFFRKRLR
ncbi:MAG: N-acetyltransferase family protein [Anaerolineales bacterium]